MSRSWGLPFDPAYAQKYRFRLVAVSDLAAFEGSSDRLDYAPKDAEDQAAELLKMAISNFHGRRRKVSPATGLPMRAAMVGFSTESIVDALGGSLDTLIAAIRKGTIRGVVGLVSCTSLRNSGQDVHSVSAALGGVAIADLPVAAAAPEYMEQKATIDAVFALALGLSG